MSSNSSRSASSLKKFDLHVHSKYSYDSFLSSKTIIKVAKKKGLSGVAVTDHGTIEGGLATKEVNNDDSFEVIVGSEIKTEFGDVLGLFLSDEIKSRKFIEACEEIKAQGGLVILAHPYRKRKVLPEDLLDHIDYIEGFNARSPSRLNLKAQELAKAYKIPMVAGSDAHLSFEIGGGWTALNGGVETLLHSEGATSIGGRESNYYLAHGLSLLTEKIKSIAGSIWSESKR